MAKRICTLAILSALCMVLGLLENLVSLSFIAPGVKLGLANSVALLLIARRDCKGALLVNLTRIFLSCLLFFNPMSLVFSLSGGLASWGVMTLLSRSKQVSVIGMGMAGGAVHNLFQLMAAVLFIGKGALFYLPVLLPAGAVSGGLIGWLAKMVDKKLKK